MRFSRLLSACLLALALLLPAPALAQSADEQAARELFEQGVALHAKGDRAAALEKFRAAYARFANPTILQNIGTTAWELGRFALAVKSYDLYLETAPADAAGRAEVSRALAEVEKKVGTLSIVVRGGPASVTLDGHVVDATRLGKQRVRPGKHEVVARRAGTDGAVSAVARRSVDVAAGGTASVVLEPGPLSEESPTQTTSVVTGHDSAPSDVGSPSSSSMTPWIVGGAGVASLAVSGVLFLRRSSEISTLDRECIDKTCPQSSQDRIDRAKLYGTAGVVTLAVGVVGVGVAVVMLGSRHGEPEAHQARVELGAGAAPGGGAAFARARF